MANEINLIITVDTEADNQWDADAGQTIDNLAYVPRFQTLCNRYGFRPTYLCTYEVAQSEAFTSILRRYQDDGVAEIGAHLHPWSTPPFDRDSNESGDRRPYPSALPVEIFTAKLSSLTERIREGTGVAPASYRAGRYGLAGEHVPILESHGYTVDCSVTPRVSWVQGNDRAPGAPDFTRAPVGPYHPDPNDVCRTGAASLLEVPVTIIYLNRLMESGVLRRSVASLRKLPYLYGATERLALDPAPRWFRPLPEMTAAKLVQVYRTAVRRGLPVVEMMLHSSELMPNGSPYYRTEESIEQLYGRLETVFDALATEGCRPVTLAEYAVQFSGRSTGTN